MAIASMTTDELARRIETPDEIPFILDVRATDQFERWRIEGKVPLLTKNIPYWTALQDADLLADELPADQEVVVVCAHGGSSAMVAELLARDNVVNLAGGMDAWATTLVPRTLWDDGKHFVVQFDRTAKACLSYAVGARGHDMAVIDPSGDMQAYLALAEEMDCTITHLFDTHLHADHVTLARDLRERTGAKYHISEGDAEQAAFQYDKLVDGETFTFGDVDLIVRSVATPGHTPGSTSLETAERFLMTGDAVFVSGVGRPDLGGETEPWARDLFHTIHDKLANLSHDLEVAPAHYTSRAESLADGTLRRRLGDLLEFDPVVSINDEAAFVEHVVGHLGSPPAVYNDIRKVNLGLATPTIQEMKDLEVGRNECALTK